MTSPWSRRAQLGVLKVMNRFLYINMSIQSVLSEGCQYVIVFFICRNEISDRSQRQKGKSRATKSITMFRLCSVFFTAAVIVSIGERDTVPLCPDLWRPVLGPPVADIWVQSGAADCPLQRRLFGPEAREALSGQRKYLPCKSEETICPISTFLVSLIFSVGSNFGGLKWQK